MRCYRREIHWRESAGRLHLLSILRRKGEVLELVGRKSEASAIYQDNITWAESSGDRRELADNLLRLGTVLQSFGQYESALMMLERARALFGELGDQSQEGRTLGIIGSILSEHQDMKKAWECYEVQARFQDQRIRAMAACNMGASCLRSGEYDRARQFLEKSLEIFHESRDHRYESMVLSNLGLVRKNQGDLDGAEVLYRRSLEMAMMVGDLEGIARVTGSIGVVNKLRGNFFAARECYRRQLEIAERIGDFKSQTNALLALGILLAEEGKFGPAMELMERRLDIETRAGDFAGKCFTLGNIGILYQQMRRYDLSADYLGQAIAQSRQMGQWALLATYLYYLSIWLVTDGKTEEAKQKVAEGLEISKTLGLKDIIFNFRLLEARMLASEDRELALRTLARLANEASTPTRGAALAYEMALASKKPQDISEAIERYERLCATNPRFEWKQALEELKQMAGLRK